jgi:hypothetical protein
MQRLVAKQKARVQDSWQLAVASERRNLPLWCLEAIMRSQTINAVQGDHEEHPGVMESLAGPDSVF